MLDFPEWNVNGICQVPNIPYTYEVTALPKLLKENGYHTIHCGKAHFGAINTPGENPYHFGFEVNIAGHAAGAPASYLGEENYSDKTNNKPSAYNAVPGLNDYWGTDTFVTEVLTLESIKELNKAKKLGQPFSFICRTMQYIYLLTKICVFIRNIWIKDCLKMKLLMHP